MKIKYRIYSIMILGVIGILIIYMYNNSQYIKYDEIESHIEQEVGHNVTIRKKKLEKSELYFLYTYRGTDNKEYIGMSFYEKKLFGRYKRIGNSLNNKVFGRYRAGNPLFYCIFGENKDHIISKIKIDFRNYVYEEKVLEQDYYLIPFKFQDRFNINDKITFYDAENKDITKKIIQKVMGYKN